MFVQEMSAKECLDTLAQHRTARLGCARDNQPYVVPIYYAYDRGADGESYLYGFTSVGQKIEWMRTNPLVCVEWDEVIAYDQWESVIAFGRYEELSSTDQGEKPPPRPPIRATPMAEGVDEGWELRRAHELLRDHTTWWQPGVAAFAASEHRNHSQPFKPFYYRVRIDRITGHRAVPDVAKTAATVTPAPVRTGEGWMRKALRRIFGNMSS